MLLLAIDFRRDLAIAQGAEKSLTDLYRTIKVVDASFSIAQRDKNPK